MKEEEDFGRANYEAYKRRSSGRSLVTGASLPDWEDQAEEIRQAWIAGALAVLDLVTN